jgi:hypothetical protein
MPSNFNFELHHFLDSMEAFLWSAIAEPLRGRVLNCLTTTFGTLSEANLAADRSVRSASGHSKRLAREFEA